MKLEHTGGKSFVSSLSVLLKNLPALDSGKKPPIGTGCGIQLHDVAKLDQLLSVNLIIVFVCQDGGELYFSDIYSNGRLTEEIKNNKVLWGVCHQQSANTRTILTET